jgi:hypothetical protein
MSSRKTGRANAAKIEHRRAVAKRRSQQIRWEQIRQLAKEQRRHRRKKMALVAAVVVAAAGVIATVLLWPEPKVKLELTAPMIAKQSPPLVIGAGPDSYNVTYQVQVIADTGTVENHLEKVSIRRPFDDHVTFYAGVTVTDSPEFDVINNFGLASMSNAGAAAEIRQGLPAVSNSDLRLDLTLDDLVKGSYFVAREQRRILDRDCTVFRTGRTVESNTVAKATDTDYVDVCVDNTGLALEEMAVNKSKVSLRVIASEVTPNPEFASDVFTINGTPLGTADGAPLLDVTDATTVPNANVLTLPTVPAGYEHKGRYILRDAPDAAAAGEGVAPTKDSYVDVYLNGTRSLIIHQGKTANEPQIDTTDAQAIDIGLLGQAKLVLGVSGNTIVVNPTGEWFIHFIGAMPAADLQALAGQLR